ncbi:lymphoid-specific helicase isoform X1 [Polypterus senegalus]|uniref:lymphoid-specific helicase isoform X1 n=1 Tax=Polypterus senegalus TaxID=55291 RepID=UPI0019654109|nr:lymphoid-specific helicase isoform X1 [Polypterus senegalus]
MLDCFVRKKCHCCNDSFTVPWFSLLWINFGKALDRLSYQSIDRRSASPQCPKPNEPEPPEGTAMAEDMSGRDSPSSEMQDIMGGIITSEMVEEEKKLMKEGQKKEQALMEKARAVWEKDAHDMRFSRLQFLLEKSNIYAKFLLTKMEQQQLEEQKRKEKLEKKASSVKQENVGLKAQDKNTGKKVGQRKRGREEDYKISDVMSKEEILNKAKKKKAETEEEEDKQQKTLLAEDLEKMSDSTFEIKDRLAQTVRHNSQHLFHPDRKVDGQPIPYQQPKIFTGGVMRWYQVEGMEWLRMLWENGINGILADEMGLGKTVQCIATIAMIVERGVRGPFLVVGPLSTLPNWMSEFNRFTPEISVILYHGHPQEREKVIRKIKQQQGPLQMNPVVITSYEIAMKDRRKLQFLHWKYLIVDEGHRIKNINCRLVQELKQFNSDNKLLLTGTPLQNNLAELWSLLNFLLPDVFDDLKSFESWFDISSVTTDAENTIAQEREQNILHMLHQILTPFLLRRLKSDVTLEVPPKREVVVFAPLTPKQEKFYTAVVNRTIQKLLGVSEQDKNPTEVTSVGRPKRRSVRAVDYCELYQDSPQDLEKLIAKLQKEADYQQSRPVVNVQEPRDAEIHLKMQNVLMLLKRCCNHPYLIEYPLDPVTQEFKVDEQLVQNSGKFLVLDRMLPELRKRGHKVLIFSQMTSILDILMDYCYLRGFQYSRLDGSMSYSEREENMRKFNCDSEVFLFLLSTRAGGLGINLTAADTVIIFDSDWNPQADLQAQDRCHRIGQTKPVMVYRLVTANTIDQKIVERAAAKRKLEKMVIHKNKFKGGTTGLNSSKSCLAPDELMELLKSRDYDREIKGTGKNVISDKDLKDLLDRSDLIDQMKKRSKKEKKGLFKVLENTDDGDIQLS